MSYYDKCKECMGRPVGIRTKDGQFHRGVITRVSRTHVYLRPVDRDLGGYGYGYGGYGPYGGYGGGWAIALAGIVGLVGLAGLFFW